MLKFKVNYSLTAINFSTCSADSVLFIASRRSAAKTYIVLSLPYLLFAGIYLTMYSFKPFICLSSFFGAATLPPLIYPNISKDIPFVNSSPDIFLFPIGAARPLLDISKERTTGANRRPWFDLGFILENVETVANPPIPPTFGGYDRHEHTCICAACSRRSGQYFETWKNDF